MKYSLESFKERHYGHDIYVLGSGATISYINPEFFRNKTVVATNQIASRLNLYNNSLSVWTHSHYHHDAFILAQEHPDEWFFCPEGDQGYAGTPPIHAPDNIIFYPHKPTDYNFDVDQAWPDSKGLLVGSTSLHGSMHLAAYLGASTIILAGADCGILDGEANHADYKSGNLVTSETKQWLHRWEMHLRQVKRKLKEQYLGLEIYSLNPFLNPNLEGHAWEGTTA